MALQLKGFEVNLFGEITYVVWDDVTREAAVVDAGMSNDAECKVIDDYISSNELIVKYLLNTHIHLDHVFGVEHMVRRYGVELSASMADEPLAVRVKQQAVMFHLLFTPSDVEIVHPLEGGDKLTLGDVELCVIDVPGHTPGGLAFYCPDGHMVLTGDSLFQGSIGRTDLPGGDYAQLIKSVTDNLLILPPETDVYPGHGPATTIGRERTYNPYL